MIIKRHSELARQIDAGWTDRSLACWPAGLPGACEVGVVQGTWVVGRVTGRVMCGSTQYTAVATKRDGYKRGLYTTRPMTLAAGLGLAAAWLARKVSRQAFQTASSCQNPVQGRRGGEWWGRVLPSKRSLRTISPIPQLGFVAASRWEDACVSS